MLDDLLEFAEKKFKGKRSRYQGRPGHGYGHGYGQGYSQAPDDPRGRGGLRSMLSQALDGDFSSRSHGGHQPGRWHDDSSDDNHGHWQGSRRRSSGGWDD